MKIYRIIKLSILDMKGAEFALKCILLLSFKGESKVKKVVIMC